ncbi:hypothetical protein BST13_21790 [Mycobacterium aquaticum]|uniref:Uncharacterized protein n=1 Tax=Mycobacterium aquaticum TaxID=1927124 RepID=A0A1X0ASK4_9MYCO|nr:hypothetical protein BST13_21790 [Mycobacterium aquaticum]
MYEERFRHMDAIGRQIDSSRNRLTQNRCRATYVRASRESRHLPGTSAEGRFACLDTEFDQGTVIEISGISGSKGQVFSCARERGAMNEATATTGY